VMTISLGTRGSQLALAQTELVKQALERIPDPSGGRYSGHQDAG
jgi:porphobilinogen deaminase